MRNRSIFTIAWWLILTALLAFFILPATGPMLGPMAFWMIMVLGFFILLGLMGSTVKETPKDNTGSAGDEAAFADPSLDAAVREVLTVNGKKARGGVIQYEGHLIQESSKAYARLNTSLGASNRNVILQDTSGGETRVLVFPAGLVATATPTRSRPAWNLLLFVLTLVTVTWAGAKHQGVNLLHEPSQLMVGLPYSLALLLILGAHELGHYFAARRHGMNVSLPYFIPVPFGLGTFGAFIRLRSLAPDRKSLFDMAVAGPLAGLVFAVLVLLFAGSRDAPTADDATALSPGRKWLGYATFVILLLILLPVPHKLFPAFGIHCPYV